MSEERNEIHNIQDEESSLDLSKAQSVPSVPDNPPLVAATPIPMAPTTVIENAEAVSVQDHDSVAVAAEVVGEESENSSSYVESTCVSAQMMTPVRASFMSRETSTMSSFTTSTEDMVARQESFPVDHEVVQIDGQESLAESHEVVSIDSPEDASPLSEEQEAYKRFHIQAERCCLIYIALAFFVFLAGTVGLVFVVLNETIHKELQVAPLAPSMGPPVPTPAPAANIPAPSDTTSPSAPSSLVPSSMPSCSGLYAQVSSVHVAQSGSDKFTMSDDGNTIVVANYDYKLSRSFLETFSLKGPGNTVVRTEATQGYAIHDMRVSGDGSRLVLGVNSYPQEEIVQDTGEEVANEMGGALLQLERIVMSGPDSISEWRVRHRVLTGGGETGSVSSVTSSWDGTTVAFVADKLDQYLIEVYREDASSGEFRRLGRTLIQPSFDANTEVEVSGDGQRLFIATSDGQMMPYTYDPKAGDWHQVAEAMTYGGGITPDIQASYNGTVVALGTQLLGPVTVFEEREVNSNATFAWSKVGTLDISANSQSQFFALSGDGRNVMMGEKFRNQPAVARLYRRSGSVFAEVQNMVLQDGLFRGMVLNEGGEQLVVAIEESVTAYRKDCAGPSL